MQGYSEYLSEKQVSQRTGFALQTLRNWRFQGIGPRYAKVNGRAIRYKWADVVDYLERHTIQTENGK